MEHPSTGQHRYRRGDVSCVQMRWDVIDGCLQADQSDRRYHECVIGWRGREVGRPAGVLVGGRFSFSGLKGCSRIAPILLLSLGEDVGRSEVSLDLRPNLRTLPKFPKHTLHLWHLDPLPRWHPD